MVWDASFGLVDWQIECLIGTVADCTNTVLLAFSKMAMAKIGREDREI